MSYILDALRKADRERNLGEVPDLEASHWGVRRPARSQRWVWIVGALLVFNGLLVAYVLFDRGSHDATTEVVAGSQTAPGQRTLVPVPRQRVEPPQPARARQPVPVRKPSPQPPARAQAPAPSFTPAPKVQTAPPASQPAVDATGEFKLQEWRDLPLEFRSQFTLPRIDVHVFDEDPGRRFIMADLKKYREGETMDNGAVLERIHPGSIQLNYEGTRFRVER
jgi:general secretion pathway protein B